jgi:CBS domain-containing protein
MSVSPAKPLDETNPRETVADVMHRGLVRCSSGTTLEKVAGLMSNERVHCVVVTECASDGSSLWGVVSDLDLIAAATVRPLGEQAAGGSAMRPAITIAPSESLAAAVQLMTRSGVAHLVVVDPVARQPVGVLSTLDLAAALSVG